MDVDYCKRSAQIPAFGNWDYANEMPITQYFESARQAGLPRYSSSSGESDPHPYIRGVTAADLYAVDEHLKNSSRNYVAHPRKPRLREKRGSNVQEMQKMQVKKRACDVTEPAKKQKQNNISKLHPHDDVVKPTATRSRILPATTRPPKPVDEDLYKIPPELLHSSKWFLVVHLNGPHHCVEERALVPHTPTVTSESWSVTVNRRSKFRLLEHYGSTYIGSQTLLPSIFTSL